MIANFAQSTALIAVPQSVWLMFGAAALILSICAGIAVIMRAWFSRPKMIEGAVKARSRPSNEGRSDGMMLVKQLQDLRSQNFAPPIINAAPSVGPHPLERKFIKPIDPAVEIEVDFELREPQDYKGPLRRTPDVRRTARQRRYYNRRQDPDEMLGRRGQNTEKDEVNDDGTGIRKKGR